MVIRSVLAGSALLFALSSATTVSAQGRSNGYTNLQVLPDTISQSALIEAMLDNLRGLGLPRRQSQGCLHCHVGDMERPVEDWDFASDDKPAKRKARVMMAMVQAINTEHLADLESRSIPPTRVNCMTCHAGRMDPRPLTTVLREVYAIGGIDSLTSRYRQLYTTYFGSAAYDFTVGVLGGLAMDLGARGEWTDAVAVAQLERETFAGDLGPRRTLAALTLRRTLADAGTDSMLAAFDRIRSGPDGQALTPAVLDVLGWMLVRQQRRDEGVAILRANAAAFPDAYVPAESLAFAAIESGDAVLAIRMLEEWLAKHPGHNLARWQLINMRAGR